VLRFRDWPGYAGPLICLGGGDGATTLAELAPTFRVLSIDLDTSRPYQALACDVAEFIQQFGFRSAVLVGEGLGALVAQLTAAWFPELVGGVVVTHSDANVGASTVLGKSLRDAPPDIDGLSVACPVLSLTELDVSRVADFVAAR
jgi:pimeloyl-ACP methyl ester carboxylesterase